MNTATCCFCHEELGQFDNHNPWPAATGEDDRCCGYCNCMVVLPARAQQMHEQQLQAN